MSIESVEANRFNEYKVVLDDVNRRRSRRQATNQLFIAINSFFLAALGAMLLSSRLTTWWTAAALVPITGFALALNGTWLRLLSRYAALLDAQSRYWRHSKRTWTRQAGTRPSTLTGTPTL